MNVEIKYRPSFATLFVTLGAGDSIVAESDAMASMSANLSMRTRFNGGFFPALVRRILGGESLFVNEFSCSGGESGQVVLTQPTPGDVEELELRGTSLYLQPGAFIACTPGIKLQIGWAGLASWFSGEGLFRLRVKGVGKVWFGGYGGVFKRQVKDRYVVDTSHILAYEPTLSMSVGLSGGIFSSMFSGEGFVAKIKGHGTLFLQSRSIDGLAAWTNSHLH